MNTETVTISPIARLEGHGKLEIFLNEAGNVRNAYFQVSGLSARVAAETWKEAVVMITKFCMQPNDTAKEG